MSATINDKLTQIKPNTTTNAPVTTVATSRSIGGVSLSCVDLTDWPTATAVHFQTYKKKADGTKDFTTAVDMKGIVSSNTIGSITITNGTDAGNAIGDYVELNPTAAYGEGVYEWGTTEHNVDGTHANVTTDSIKEQTASGLTLKDSSGNEYLKTSKTASAVNEITITNAATGNAPQLSASGGDTNIDFKIAGKGTGVPWLVGGKIKGLIGNRQGGSATVYGTAGTSTQTSNTDEVMIQVGAVATSAGGDTTVTFPTAFAQVPLVFGTANSASGASTFAVVVSVTASQFVVRTYTGSARDAETLAWMAIGPVA